MRILAALLLLIPMPGLAKDLQTAVLAGGCFWCVEADFDKVEGVVETTSGFAGGTVDNPSYKQVVRGGTGHLEVVQITYDADVVGYDRIIDLFLRSIDPLDDGGQFCDRGESYTTAIFTRTPQERQIAETAAAKASEALGRTVRTAIRDDATFYPAEEYHQDFYKKSPVRYTTYRQGCRRDARVEQLWGDAAFPGS